MFIVYRTFPFKCGWCLCRKQSKGKRVVGLSGWDKIFYFVGTNTFSRKFRPKQRESDATGAFKIAVIWKKSFFLWQEISSDAKKWLLVIVHFCLCQEIFSCDKKFLPVTRNFFLWQEISQIHTKTARIVAKISYESEDFVGTWPPGSPGT